MTEISSVIIAKNEEKKISECIKSLKWTDEVILIDNGSTDETALIAKRAGVKVFLFPNIGYSELRNWGLKKAKGKWILYVDADERVDLSLREEIFSKIQNEKGKFNAYAIPRKNIILGREMKHGGWWPDYVKRLYRKEFLKGWRGRLHEEPIFEGEMEYLKNALVHVKEDNLSDMVVKTNTRSQIEAKLMYEANHPKMNLLRFISAIFREFWLRIVIKKAYLDGTEGLIFGIYQIYSKFISYSKLWEIQLKTYEGSNL